MESQKLHAKVYFIGFFDGPIYLSGCFRQFVKKLFLNSIYIPDSFYILFLLFLLSFSVTSSTVWAGQCNMLKLSRLCQ